MIDPFPGFKLDRACLEWANVIKRKTGLRHWNEICRIAFCHSLAQADLPMPCAATGDSHVEIAWRTFGGERSPLYAALLAEASTRAPAFPSSHALFLAHLARGLQHMAAQDDGLPVGLKQLCQPASENLASLLSSS